MQYKMKVFTLVGVILLAFFFVPKAYAVVEISDGSIKTLWHMEDATDSSGNGKNLTATGGSFTCTGKLGAGCWDSLSTTANLNNLILTATSGLPTGDFTIGYWMNVQTAMATGYTLGGKTEVDVGFAYNALCVANSFEFKVQNTCPSFTAFNLGTATWKFVVLERLGTKSDLWVDNALNGNETDGDALVWALFRINGLGFVGAGGDTGHDFLIDEVFLSNVAISTSTRDSLYNTGTGDTICVTVGCATPASAAPRRKNPSPSLINKLEIPNLLSDFRALINISYI